MSPVLRSSAILFPLSLAASLGCTSLTGSSAFESLPSEDAAGKQDDARTTAPDAADADVLVDATPDGAVLFSAPKQVRCRSSQCDLAAGRTCCAPIGAAVCGMCGVAATLDCDEAADCDAPQKCCIDAAGDRTRCVASGCPAGSQACMTDAECETGKCAPFVLGGTTLGRCS